PGFSGLVLSGLSFWPENAQMELAFAFCSVLQLSAAFDPSLALLQFPVTSPANAVLAPRPTKTAAANVAIASSASSDRLRMSLPLSAVVHQRQIGVDGNVPLCRHIVNEKQPRLRRVSSDQE